MSFAMDDVGGLKLNSFVSSKQTEETRTVEKPTDVKQSKPSAESLDFSDEYEISNQKLRARQKELEEFQQKFTDIQIKEQQSASKAEIKPEKEPVDPPPEKQEIKANKNNLVRLDLKPENKENEQEFEVKLAQQSPPKDIPVETLKTKAVESVKEKPEQSIKIHIRHLDRDLLLAMLSLRTG